MAWQLIYTSAPRSLEAGRSGFGTVARHRAISPLLVSAIERASQFSRLAGVDTGRVIFTYRIITVAGGRFHVLSSIRDAGADYTGRTNHIAHHLIADPREIAQLSENDPSPADVLLAMEWATSWTEQPRFLETTDEVALATIRPQEDGSAWQQITGRAEQAWLLASGEASRGAYVIQPAGTDLRAVFAESLRLIPERLWQISFTTSLQPSDEPADFRWIGIEERSPLRTKTESSARPVLNLTVPSTLPLVELVRTTAPSPVPQTIAQTPMLAPAEKPTAPSELTPVSAPWQPNNNSNEQPVAARSAPISPPRILPQWWLLAGAGAVAVVSLAAVAVLFLKPLIEREKARKAVEASFKTDNYFSEDTCRKMAAALVPTIDPSLGNTIAHATKRLIQTLRDAKLDNIRSEETNAAIATLADVTSPPIPEELRRLQEIVVNAQRLANDPPGFEKAQSCKELAQITEKWRSDISAMKQETPLPALSDALNANVDRRQAATLLKMLENPSGPPEATLFAKAVEAFAERKLDREALETVKQIRQKLSDGATQATKQKPEAVRATLTPPRTPEDHSSPEWLRSSSPTTAIVASSNAPIYLANGLSDLNNLTIKELKDGLSYYLNPGLQGVLEPLIKFESSGKLRRKNPTTDPVFEIVGAKISAIESSREMPGLPFALIAREAPDKDIMQIWVVAESQTPLFSKRPVAIRRARNTLIIDATPLGIPGTILYPLRLSLPEDCAIPGMPTTPLPVENWNVDLEPLIADVNTRLEAEEQPAKARTNSTQQEFQADKEKLIQIANLSDDLKNKDSQISKHLVAESAPLFQQAGGCIMAATQKDPFPKSNDLFETGKKLRNMDERTDVTTQRTVLNEALGNTAAVRKQLEDDVKDAETSRQKATNRSEEKMRPLEAKVDSAKSAKASSIPIIETIEDLIKVAAKEKPRMNRGRKEQPEEMTKKTALVKLLAHLNLSTRPPIGRYRLFVHVGGKDFLLSEFEVKE